jgi:hypothetical protein
MRLQTKGKKSIKKIVQKSSKRQKLILKRQKRLKHQYQLSITNHTTKYFQKIASDEPKLSRVTACVSCYRLSRLPLLALLLLLLLLLDGGGGCAQSSEFGQSFGRSPNSNRCENVGR